MSVPRYQHPVFALQYHLDEGDASHLDDLAHYTSRLAPAASAPAPVLELAAGTGRATRALVAAGVPVVPLDIGHPMLRILSERPELRDRVTPVCADMTRLPLRTGSMAAALAAYNSLACLLDRPLVASTFAEVHRVLVPGGRLHFDVAANRPEDRPPGTLDLGWRDWTAPDGLHIRRHTRLRPRPELERIDLRYDYRWHHPGAPEKREEVVFSMNGWPPETYLDALGAAGFAVDSVEDRTFESSRGAERHWVFVAATKLV